MKKVYYSAGVWDLFHIGHLNAIRKAREIAKSGTLIIGVSTDELAKRYKGEFPIIPYEQRRAIIESLIYPDQIVTQTRQFDREKMKELGVDVVLMGEDWKEKMPPHLKKLTLLVKVIYLPRPKGINTTEIKNRIRKLE